MAVPVDYAHLGDPEGMEALAAELQLRAESISGVGASLDRQLDGITFVGPAADQLREEMKQRRRRADKVATGLQGAAHALRRGAALVREQIHELRLAEARAAEREGPR